MRLKDLSEICSDELKDPEFAAGYLQAAMEENDLDTFLVVLKDILHANGVLVKTVLETEQVGKSFYKALSENGFLEFPTLQAVLKSVGLQFSITPHSGN